jgi:signal transduction histidine kinase
LYAVLLAVAFAATALIVRQTATAAAERDLRQTLQLEVDAITHELDAEGLEAAAAAIAARAERPGAPEYWLTDPSGRTLIGDVPALEGPNGWHTETLSAHPAPSGSETDETLLVLTKSFPDGVRLSVGEDLAESRRTISQTILILTEVGTLSVVAVLLAGYLVTRNSLQRLDDITHTLDAVGEGRLDERVPVREQFLLADLDRIATGINRMLDRNQALVDGLRRVSRDIAHDLRTPLSHLQQRLEQAREAPAAEKDREIGAAEEKAQQIVGTFNAILRLAEIEAGSAKARFATVDLAEIAETIADAYRPDVEDTGGSLRSAVEGPALVRGDSELLMQAAANLVENAFRHSPPGTEITISTTAARVPTLAVTDTGPGVPDDALDAVTTPFYRLDASRSTAGAGLGLSITRAIAELHGAQLDLENLSPGFRAAIRFTKPS